MFLVIYDTIILTVTYDRRHSAKNTIEYDVIHLSY